MAGTEDIKKIGGFLTEGTGQLKARDQLAKELKSTETETSAVSTPLTADDPVAISATLGTPVQNGLAAVTTKFTEQVNAVASVINENQSNVKAAQDIVGKQQAAAAELRKAIQNNDTPQADEKRAELAALKEARNSLSDQVTKAAREDGSGGAVRTSVAIGNDQRGSVAVNKASFSSDPGGDLTTVEGVDKFIAQRQSDSENLSAQDEDLDKARKELTDIFTGGRDTLVKISGRASDTEDQATQRTQSLVAQIGAAGTQGSLVNNVNESVVRSLLS